jgi:hypothetical protein
VVGAGKLFVLDFPFRNLAHTYPYLGTMVVKPVLFPVKNNSERLRKRLILREERLSKA